MNNNAFTEFNLNSNLAVRKPTRAYDCVLSTCSLYTISLSHVIICGDYNTRVLRASKAFMQLTSQMLKWYRTLPLIFRGSEKAVTERYSEGLGLLKDLKEQVW